MDIIALESLILRLAALIALIIGLVRFIDHEIRLFRYDRRRLIANHEKTTIDKVGMDKNQQEQSQDSA